jgi:cytochrome b involved in lipid metabolism
LTLDEVAKHKTQNDCWMVIEDCVYNLTDYLKQHPGGAQKLMMGAGKDATQLFRKYHAYIQHK